MVCLENVLKISLQEVLKMSWRHLEDVFKRLEEVLKTFWRSLEDVFKTSWRCLEDVLKTSWRRLEDIWPRQIHWSWPRRLEDVFKTSFEDVRLRRTYSSSRMFAGFLLNFKILLNNLKYRQSTNYEKAISFIPVLKDPLVIIIMG